MLKRIRIRNFESHEDTTLKDFSPGFNAIVGLSNAGKTSVVRVLKLLAFNEFSQESLRHGCDNCEVEAETDKGIVKVTKGKKNLWEITDFATGKTSVFDKIGKNILSEATRILGFGLVKLGDMELQVNIMDQLEAHFMLEEFAGKDATGSLRAQVVDEISGLHGIEPLIRSVGLDNNRLTREVNAVEEKKKELAAQLHDESLLRDEEAVLDKANTMIVTHDENRSIVVMLVDIQGEHGKVVQSIADRKAELAGLPDEQMAGDLSITAATNLEDARKMAALHDDWSAEATQTSALDLALKNLPDSALASDLSDKAGKSLASLESAQSMLDVAVAERREIERLSKDSGQLSDDAAADQRLKLAAGKMEILAGAEKLLDDWLGQKVTVAAFGQSLKEMDEELSKAQAGLETALGEVDICPVTMGAIGDECRKQAKIT